MSETTEQRTRDGLRFRNELSDLADPGVGVRMKNTVCQGAWLILLLVPATVFAQAPILVDFDNLAAPCDLGSAQPLRDEYLALGVEFWGMDGDGAAVLDECSGLGVPGYSPPNYAVIAPEAVLASGGVPERMVFGFTADAPNRVRVVVGGTPGATVFLSCTICPWSVPWCDVGTSVVLDTSTTTLEVWSVDRFQLGCSVSVQDPAVSVIVDDIELISETRVPKIPTISAFGAVVLLMLVAVFGLAVIRKPECGP